MKTIKLTTDSPFFRQEQFGAEMFNGKETPVMKQYKEDSYSESLLYSLFTPSFDALPLANISDCNGTMRKYMCVADNLYIIVERGEKGFESSFHFFACEIKASDAEWAITINPVDDKNITEVLYDKYVEQEYTVTDCFNERAIEVSGKLNSLEQIKMIESTEFIHLPHNGNQRRIAVRLSGEGKLLISNPEGYKHIDTGNYVSGEVEIGTVFYKRDQNVRNMVEILKLHGYAHDFNGDFWAVAESVYSYPADADKIKSAYSDFYTRECMPDAIFQKQELLKNAKELPYVRNEYRIGDGIIHVPVETTAAEISIPISDFHFIVSGKLLGHLTHKEKGYLRLNHLPYLCSLIEIERQFRFVVYKTAGFVKCGDRYYAELKFHYLSKPFDTLDASLGDISSYEKSILACAGYLMFRNIIKPVIINKDQFGEKIKSQSSPIREFHGSNELDAIMGETDR